MKPLCLWKAGQNFLRRAILKSNQQKTMKQQPLTGQFSDSSKGRVVRFIIRDNPSKWSCPTCKGNAVIEAEPGFEIECPRCNEKGYVTQGEIVYE